MGTPLTGSSVASTYTALLKTTDNAVLSGSLRTISDGGGNDSALQLSTAGVASTGTLAVTGATNLSTLTTSGNVSIGGALSVTGNLSVPGTLSSTGNFSVNTNKFTVDATSGNTAALGTLSCTGNLAVNGTKFFVTAASGNTSVEGTLGVTGATNLSSLSTSGAATVGTTLGVTGNFLVATNKFTVDASNGNTLAAGTLNATGNFEVGAAKFTVAAASGNTVVAGTLDVTGTTTLAGNLAANADTTIGNANTDVLTINSNNVTLPNITAATIDYSNDTVLIRDQNDSNKLRSATMAQFTPQCVQTIFQGINSYTAVNTGSGTEITDLTSSMTPRSSSSKILVTIVLNYHSLQPFRGVFRLTRNGTEVGSNSNGTSLYGIAPVVAAFNFDQIVTTVISFYDTSPSSGSNTYKINVFSAGAGGVFTDIYLNRNYNDVGSGPNNFDRARTSCTMTLQEVLA